MSWSPRADRHSHDFYIEQAWVTEALLDAPEFADDDLGKWHGYDTYLDPCCGSGTIPSVLDARGYTSIASDLEDRGYPWASKRDFLGDQDGWEVVQARNPALSIIANPPYSYVSGVLEAFIRRALELATGRVAMLVPLGRLSGIERHWLYMQHRPLAVCILMERPSMPRGDLVEMLGAAAFRRGRIDYCWIVWDVNQRAPQTRTIFLCPRADGLRRSIARRRAL